MSAFEEFKKILVEDAGIQPALITAEANFEDDLGFDSLDQIEILMTVEEVFGIEVEENQMESLLTVGDAVNYIDAAMAGRR